VIEQSPANARLVVIASNSVFADTAMRLVGQALGEQYRKPAELALNIVESSLEDAGLLGIRSRSSFARTLDPLPADQEAAWEYGNYAAALAGLFIVWGVHRQRRRAATRHYQQLLQEV
jgi:ABC-2 type transport system permease protein